MFALFHPLLCLCGMKNPCHSGMPMQNPDTQIQIKFFTRHSMMENSRT